MIIGMERVLMAGPRGVLEQFLKTLHSEKLLHVSNPLDNETVRDLGFKTGVPSAQRLEAAEKLLFDVKQALRTIGELVPEHKDILSFDPPASMDWLESVRAANISAICRDVSTARARIAKSAVELESVKEHERRRNETAFWIEFAGAFKLAEAVRVTFYSSDAAVEREFESMLSVATGGAHVLFGPFAGTADVSLVVVYPGKVGNKLAEEVFKRLAGKILVSKYTTTSEEAPDGDDLLERELSAVGEAKAGKETLAEQALRHTSLLRTAERGLEYEIKKMRFQNFVCSTEMVFCITGWIPATRSKDFTELLDERYSGRIFVLFTRPVKTEYSDVPVLLDNPVWARPFERLLGFFPPPVYGSVDPVVTLVFSFPLFFGLIIGDAGYSSVLVIAAWFVGVRGKGNLMWEDVARILYVCGFSGLFFGIVFGEFFGFSTRSLGLPTSFFDRESGTASLLAGVLALGGLHLMLGNILGAFDSYRRGSLAHAATNVLSLGIILGFGWTAYRWFSGGVVDNHAVAVLAFAVVGNFILRGPMGVMESVRLVSCILSYSRIMALGMASLMLAVAANKVYAVGSHTVGLLGGLCLHFLNLGLGVLSPLIQSLRLHVVEFFGQFARQGAVRFAPFGTE